MAYYFICQISITCSCMSLGSFPCLSQVSVYSFTSNIKPMALLGCSVHAVLLYRYLLDSALALNNIH